MFYLMKLTDNSLSLGSEKLTQFVKGHDYIWFIVRMDSMVQVDFILREIYICLACECRKHDQ